MTREELVNSSEYKLRNAAIDWCETRGVDQIDAFEAGAKWADKNLNPKTIAEFLYKEKNYPISLNGEIPTFEETMKDVQIYDAYKMKQWIENSYECRQTKKKAKWGFVTSFIRKKVVEHTKKQTIENACKWLKRNTILAETTIERFKQAMEE